jgi:YgiT-type zinc finger domain-containing protein
MEKSYSNYTINRKDFHLFVQNIPAYVCSQCGEKYFGEEEVEAIQDMAMTLELNVEKVRAAG